MESVTSWKEATVTCFKVLPQLPWTDWGKSRNICQDTWSSRPDSRPRPPEHEAGTVRVEVTWKSYFINYLKWFQHGGRMNFKGISKMVQ